MDALTGLLNRAAVLARLADALRDRGRAGGAVAVLFIDLDRFKAVNDTHGHAAGDAVLREVAARLRRAVRPDDVVGRLGGDEFVLVLAGEDSTSRAGQVAGRVRACLTSPVSVAGRTARVGASIGVATAGRGDDVTGRDLLARGRGHVPGEDRAGPNPDRPRLRGHVVRAARSFPGKNP